MTSLGESYEKLMKFIRFFVNQAPGVEIPEVMPCLIWNYSTKLCKTRHNWRKL